MAGKSSGYVTQLHEDCANLAIEFMAAVLADSPTCRQRTSLERAVGIIGMPT